MEMKGEEGKVTARLEVRGMVAEGQKCRGEGDGEGSDVEGKRRGEKI